MAEELEFEQFHIEIEETLFVEINQFMAKQDHEVGGLLLGEVYFQERQARLSLLVKIRQCLWAKGATPLPDSLQFTDETLSAWDRARQQFPGLQVVGWVHSHPGYGVFFSGHDLANQEKYFNRPWHIGWVIDPAQGEQSIYRWQDDLMMETDQWQLVRSLGKRKAQELFSNRKSMSRSEDPVAATMEIRLPEATVLQAEVGDAESWQPPRSKGRKEEITDQVQVHAAPRSGVRVGNNEELPTESGSKMLRWLLVSVSVFAVMAVASFGLYKVLFR